MSKIIKTAGGVVVRGKKMLFIKKNGRWEFPKGRLKKGANRKNTAVREICEETGLKKKDLNIIKPLIPTHHHNKINGDIFINMDCVEQLLCLFNRFAQSVGLS